MARVEFEVITSKGAVMKTTSDRRIATRFAAENADGFPGLVVVEVTYLDPLRRRVWRDRNQLRIVA